VRRRPFAKTVSSKAVLLVLLALQLVVGMQLQAARAATMSMSPEAMSVPTAVVTAGAAAQPDCPTHSAHGATHSAAHNVRTSANLSGVHEHNFEHAPTFERASLGKHATGGTGTRDCCQASACQCHCVYTPGSIALPALANIATSVAIPSLASARVVAPRIDEFLRPPIV
jgi:hypothetical protein